MQISPGFAGQAASPLLPFARSKLTTTKPHCRHIPNSHFCCWLGTPLWGCGSPYLWDVACAPCFPSVGDEECCGDTASPCSNHSAVESQKVKPRGAELSSCTEQTSLPKGLEDHLHAQNNPPCLNQTILTSL